MLAAVRDNYSSTTDLADTIALKSGIGYRQIYAIIGGLVDSLIEQGKPLYTLTAGEIMGAAAEPPVWTCNLPTGKCRTPSTPSEQ